MKKSAKPEEIRFHRGDRVMVDYEDPSGPAWSHKGPGVFVEYVTESTPGYDTYAGDHALVRLKKNDPCCCFPLDSLSKPGHPKKTKDAGSYLTKRLMKQIVAGGIVIAPRRAGKTTAVVELMRRDPSYVLVCLNHSNAQYAKQALTLRGVVDAEKRVASGESIPSIRGRVTADSKVIIDEFFWNSAFTQIPYHCAVSSSPKRMVVYNAKGRNLTVNSNGEDIWKG